MSVGLNKFKKLSDYLNFLKNINKNIDRKLIFFTVQ